MTNSKLKTGIDFSVIINGIDISKLGLANEDCIVEDQPETDNGEIVVGKNGDQSFLGNVQALCRPLRLKILVGSIAFNFLSVIAEETNKSLTTAIKTVSGSFSKTTTNNGVPTTETYSSTDLILKKTYAVSIHANAGEEQAIAEFTFGGVFSKTIQ